MASKTTRDMLKSKWGLKSNNAKSEAELEKCKRDNEAIKKDIAGGKGKLTDKERDRLLEKILSLETEKEKNCHHLVEKDREIQRLQEQLGRRNCPSEERDDLEEKAREAKRREQLLKSFSEETDILKTQLSTATTRLSELESKASAVQLTQETALDSRLGNIGAVELQLKDALEKNQQWLKYDQQREVYVRSLLAKIIQLEQQAAAVAQPLQKKAEEGNSEGYLSEEKRKYYDRLFLAAKRDLEVERQTVTQLRFDLNEFQRKYEAAKQEVCDLSHRLYSQREADVQTLEDQSKMEKIQRLKKENELSRRKLEEEKKRSEELLSQVQFLYTCLSKHEEEHTRITWMEQQIQACTTDFENEKLDRQNMQRQLHKVLLELRRAREQITRLEPLKQLCDFAHLESLKQFQGEQDAKLKNAVTPARCSSLLDESFLECPKCQMQYPTSQHRELLAHIDYCAN
ncbi:centrosomal protein of 55 kDa [Tachyglossus aculeatus]|uniref:centrosomal protein of 55 kDa n=1 Tax=Tachyglossus aculeatus TaxID=9261 RepID=UPI0018F74C28|nr:centrosomal protein of 55 kDa [Tachyglossus aculeatus]